MTTPHPPRVLLDVDGRAVCARVHRPEREADPAVPPVVLAAGGAGQGTDGAWGPELETRLARHALVLTYDRAGSGRSDGPPHATVAGMAEDLEQILRAAGVPPPVVVAGWSLGGFVAQGYALRYPDHVAGLVFIDPTPTEPPPSTWALRMQLATVGPQMRAFALASRAGAFSGRLGRRLARRMAGADATPDTEALMLGLLRSPAALNALVDTMSRVRGYAAELETALAHATLPDVPTAVITAGRRAGVPAEYVANIEAAHRRLVERFPRGRAVPAPHASHQVPFDDPDAVADTIKAVALAARER